MVIFHCHVSLLEGPTNGILDQPEKLLKRPRLGPYQQRGLWSASGPEDPGGPENQVEIGVKWGPRSREICHPKRKFIFPTIDLEGRAVCYREGNY